MSKVLFMIPPSQNHMNPTLGVVRELVERGEEVVYFTSEVFRKKIESLGASVKIYNEQLKWYGDNGNVDIDSYGLEGLVKQSAGLLMGNSLTGRIMMRSVEETAPDYVIHDAYCLWSKFIVRKLGIPAVASVATPAYNRKMMDLSPEDFVKYVLRSQDKSLIPNIAKIIASLETNFKKKYDIEDFCDIFVAKEALNIVYTSRYFQPYVESFDESFRFVGASVHPRNETIDFPFEKLDGRPLIYIAMGGVVNKHAEFYRKCFMAFDNPDYQVVLSMGKIDPNEIGIDIPENFIARSFVPQLDLLERADIFVTHGGINSVSEGLYYNVPQIAVPFFGDQCWIAKRIEELGAGIYLEHGTITHEDLREAANRIFSDSSFKANSTRIGDSFRQEGCYKRAADEIIAFKEKVGIM